MQSPTIITLTFLIVAHTAVNTVYASIDIENIIQTLQQLQQQQKNEQLVKVKEETEDSSDSSEEVLTFGSLKPEAVEKLIQSALKDATQDKTKYVKNTLKSPAVKEKDTSGDINLYTLLKELSNQAEDDDKSNEKVYFQLEPERKKKTKQAHINSYMEQISKLIPESNGVRQKHIYTSKKKQLQPNDLLGDASYSKPVNRAEPSDLNDYSKVYVILNVDAIQHTKMRNRLSDLVYSLLQPQYLSKQNDNREQKRESRYKGFLVSDDYRRGGKRRHSNEADSLDYKPKAKRLRSRDNGAGGRTPIPYIRHRGDIYEKEN